MESDSDEQAADHGAGCGKCAIIEQYQGSSQMTDSWPYHQIQDLVEPDSPVSYGVVKPGEEGDIPFVRGGDLSDGKVLQSQLRTITREVSDQYKRTLLRGGELLICLVGQPGQVGVAPPSLAGANIARQVGIVRLLEIVIPEFASYFLRSPQGQKQLGSYTGGSVQQVINLVDLRKVFVPIPPLPEQQRIVALLDEALAGLATAKANAERNLQNARTVFESHLEDIFSRRGERWEQTKLEAVLATLPQNGWSPPAANHTDSGTPVLTLSSVTGFRFRADKIKYTSAQTVPGRSYWVKNGDLLITRSNTPELVGHVAIAAGIEQPTIYPDLIMRMNPLPERMNTEFLYYQLRTPALRTEITGRAQGANPTMKKISNGAVRTLPILLPPIKEQLKIVATLQELSAETQRLTQLYDRKLAALEELKQSLLQQAFNGEL